MYGTVRTRASLKTGDGKSPLSAECLSEPDNGGDMPFSQLPQDRDPRERETPSPFGAKKKKIAPFAIELRLSKCG